MNGSLPLWSALNTGKRMDRELKQVMLSIVMQEERARVTVKAYTTNVAGVVVAARRDYVIKGGKETVVRRNNNWCIWTYPVGLRLLAGLPSKEKAIEFAETHLGKYQWVALVRADIEKSNDMKTMYAEFIGYRKMIAAMRDE